MNAYIAGQIKNNKQYVIIIVMQYIFGSGMIIGITALFTGPDTEIIQVENDKYLTLAGLSIMGGAAPYL